MPPKTPITCNWVKSIVIDSTFDDFMKTVYLPKKEIMSYRAPNPTEEKPQPKEGEVIVFTDHMNRGFPPPGLKFFRDVLHFFDLHPQDIKPNSMSNICNFQVFCEVYLGEEPSLLLLRELFYLNRQNERANGPSLKLGGVSIQRRRDAIFPYANPPSHPKDWNQTWLYCQDTSPAYENPLPSFRALCLESNHPLPDKLSAVECQKLAPTMVKVKALLGNGLSGIDLVRVWLAWRIIPLSRRPGLMCTYTCEKNDPLRHSPDDLPDDVIDNMTKSLLNESLADCGKVGLNPFCKANPTPAANDKFWKEKYDHEAAKRARKAKRAARKAAVKKKGNKSSASDLLRLEDTSESEVALDSLGSFFNHLIDTDYHQEDTRTSNRVDEEIHESRRQTRTSKDVELSSVLPNTPRKRRNEDTLPSSDDSLQSNMPAFKTAPGGKAKPSKKVKKSKPAEEPSFKEPELQTAAPEASVPEPPLEPAHDTPTSTIDPPAEQTADGSENLEVSSPAKIDDPQDADVVITKTGYTEPGRPTVLAKCSAKEEHLERCKVRFDVADYTHMSIGEVFSGYLSQVHSSRDLEVDMVKQMH
ncbi:uncharacterized protein [Triticum aestivum]|uniref:uncharacterized protein isoform X3 n=1 Tax=Triticum aestivum TaxID=4565 RepID=UPI001D004F94|nr:uncharacterized protein LOC123039621 isoform X3 [Triticum aestivum]